MIEYLNTLRAKEFDLVFRNVDVNTRALSVLELGSGTGHQLKLLEGRFANATGVELKNSNYIDVMPKNIILYDGYDIPFENENFDFVFSSNVLEHVPAIEHMVSEMARVTKKGGYALHVMPTHTWRFWTTIAGYLSIFTKPFKKRSTQKRMVSDSYKSTVPKSNFSKVMGLLFQPKHGERGNTITEAYYFHPYWWRSTLTNGNYWTIEKAYGNNLFYTGHNLLGNTLSWKTRMVMAKFLGSACKVYFLKKK